MYLPSDDDFFMLRLSATATATATATAKPASSNFHLILLVRENFLGFRLTRSRPQPFLRRKSPMSPSSVPSRVPNRIFTNVSPRAFARTTLQTNSQSTSAFRVYTTFHILSPKSCSTTFPTSMPRSLSSPSTPIVSSALTPRFGT